MCFNRFLLFFVSCTERYPIIDSASLLRLGTGKTYVICMKNDCLRCWSYTSTLVKWVLFWIALRINPFILFADFTPWCSFNRVLAYSKKKKKVRSGERLVIGRIYCYRCIKVWVMRNPNMAPNKISPFFDEVTHILDLFFTYCGDTESWPWKYQLNVRLEVSLDA